MNQLLNKLKNNKGFLLVDSVVGLVIIGIGLVALSALFAYGTQHRGDAEIREKAVQLAVERVELMKSARISAIDATGIQNEVDKYNNDPNNKADRSIDGTTFHIRVYMLNASGKITDTETGSNMKTITGSTIASDANIYPIAVVVDWDTNAIVPGTASQLNDSNGMDKNFVVLKSYVETKLSETT